MNGYRYDFIRENNLDLVHEYYCKDNPLHGYVKQITVPYKALFVSACCSYVNNKEFFMDSAPDTGNHGKNKEEKKDKEEKKTGSGTDKPPK